MTQEQKEVLTAWCNNMIATYRIDFFRGVVLTRVVKYLCAGGSHILMRSISLCQEAERLGLGADTKDYTELLKELREIAKGSATKRHRADCHHTHLRWGLGRGVKVHHEAKERTQLI